MTQRITHARIDALISKLERVQADIDKMRLGDTKAADSERVAALRIAHQGVDVVKDVVDKARPR